MLTPPNVSRVTCHDVSRVTFHVSRVTCHMSHVTFFGQSGEDYWWRVCYQRGLPRLVSFTLVVNLFTKFPSSKMVTNYDYYYYYH